MARPWTLLLTTGLVATFALAGCFGGDDNDDATDGDRSRDGDGGGGVTVGGNVTGGNTTVGGNSTVGGNMTGNQTGDDWQTEHRNGTVSGVASPVDVPSSTETFEVLPDVELLFVNITTDGGQVTMRVTPPGCADDTCAEETTTEEGRAAIEVMSPQEGQWTILLEGETAAGPVEVQYSITITQGTVG